MLLRAIRGEARVMGMVLSFVPRVTSSHQRSETAGQAAIIIFPGVRYERTEPADLCGRLDRNSPLSAMPAPPKPKH